MQISVKIENIDGIRAALRSFPERVKPFLRDASMKSAFMIERNAKILAPVDTGRLRSSIATSLGIADQGLSSIVQTNVNYAIFVHEGTKRMPGRPFMEQAAEQSRDQINQIYDYYLGKALDNIAQ